MPIHYSGGGWQVCSIQNLVMGGWYGKQFRMHGEFFFFSFFFWGGGGGGYSDKVQNVLLADPHKTWYSELKGVGVIEKMKNRFQNLG